VEGTVREVKRRVGVVASSYRAIDRSVTRWIVVTMVEWSSEVRCSSRKFFRCLKDALEIYLTCFLFLFVICDCHG